MNPSLNSFLRFVVGAAILLGGFLFMKALISMKKTPPISIPPKAVKEVRTMVAEVGVYPPETYVQGRAVAKHKIDLYSEVNGQILPGNKEFREGVHYAAGEVVFRLDAEEVRLQLTAQRTALLQLLTSSLADIKIDYPDRFDVWQNYTRALDVNKVLPALPEPASDSEKFFLSNRGILSQFYTIRSAEERLAKYTIRAPFSGVVSESMVNAGALVRPGQKLGALMNISSFEVETAIPSSALDVVQVGDQVGLSAEENSGHWNGTVSRIADYIDPTTQTAKVFISVQSNTLKDGQYLLGVIRSKPVADVVKVPTELLTDNDELFGVQDSTLVLLQSTLIHKSIENALLAGIPPGTVLLAEPLPNAYDGLKVKPVAQ